MNATTAQTASSANLSNVDGLTSLLVIGAALAALCATIVAAAWHVAVPMVGMVSGIVSALA